MENGHGKLAPVKFLESSMTAAGGPQDTNQTNQTNQTGPCIILRTHQWPDSQAPGLLRISLTSHSKVSLFCGSANV